MKVQAIIPAAGLGTRLQTQSSKPLVPLHGQPLIVYTLKAFEKSPHIDSVILVGHPRYLSALSKIVSTYSLRKVIQIIAGGKTRTESVGLGLKATDSDTDIVVIHDAARACVSVDLIEESIKQCQRQKAVVVGVPVKSTIKKVRQQTIRETLKRNELWEIQTPQVFKRSILVKAYDRLAKDKKKFKDLTDDASLVEKIGIPVKVSLGDYRNIKITTPEDLALAKVYLKS